MTVLFVILPILVLAGAFMWMRPSGRDQHLAKLRSDALINGFRIGSMRIPDLSEYGRVHDKHIIITMYQLSLTLEEGETSQFTAVRTTGESGAYLPEGWAWDDRQHLNEAQLKIIRDLLIVLPMSVSALCLSTDSVALSWDEKDENLQFSEIKTLLTNTSDAFSRRLITA